jgi:hypothetical protein
MNRTCIVGLGLLFATTAHAQVDASQFPANTTIRDYAKRDRLLLGGLEYISPAQLHENAGLRARVGADLQMSQLEQLGQESDLRTPTASAAFAYGLTDLTLGVQTSYSSATNEAKGPLTAEEEFTALKVRPEVAYTFGANLTAGVGIEFSSLDVREDLNTVNEYDYDYARPVAALSFHTPKLEVGAVYTAEVQDSATRGNANREGTLSLATSADADERAIYLPAMGTLYARGNLTNAFSVTSAVSVARYDGNVDGAVQLFEDYKTEDRLAAKLLGSYWTTERSRVSLAAEYKGAATTAVGSEEAGLGYRLANLYGGTVEGILSLNRSTYLGLNASYMRGERDDTESTTAVRYNGKEETSKVSGFVTVKL